MTFGDRVKVVKGFYKGLEGLVLSKAIFTPAGGHRAMEHYLVHFEKGHEKVELAPDTLLNETEIKKI